jgi:hypothetical protein
VLWPSCLLLGSRDKGRGQGIIGWVPCQISQLSPSHISISVTFYWPEFNHMATSNYVIVNYNFFFLVLQIELRALYLLGKHSTTWAMHPVLLALVCFLIGSHAFVQAGLGLGSSHLLHCSWSYRCALTTPPPHPACFSGRVLLTFLPELALNYYSPIFASCIAGIAGVWNYTWPWMPPHLKEKWFC